MRNRHTSPFEAVTFTFGITAPIFVVRQWHRHRTQSYNEVSARYTELPDKFYIPDPALIGLQSKDNKQMRTDEENKNAKTIKEVIKSSSYYSYKGYQSLIKMGCPRELARSVLPLNIYTRFSATLNLHNLFHFLNLRLHEHAQYEIRVYAEAILELIEPIVPVCLEAFLKHR